MEEYSLVAHLVFVAIFDGSTYALLCQKTENQNSSEYNILKMYVIYLKDILIIKIIITNSMAYETRRFNAALTRALQ